MTDETLELLRDRALALELAIRGGLASGIVDRGAFGLALGEAAHELGNLAMELCCRQFDHPGPAPSRREALR